jgi:hypothetical protein
MSLVVFWAKIWVYIANNHEYGPRGWELSKFETFIEKDIIRRDVLLIVEVSSAHQNSLGLSTRS